MQYKLIWTFVYLFIREKQTRQNLKVNGDYKSTMTIPSGHTWGCINRDNIQTEQVALTHLRMCVCVCVCTFREKEAMNFRESNARYMRVVGEWKGKGIIINCNFKNTMKFKNTLTHRTVQVCHFIHLKDLGKKLELLYKK